MTDIHDELHRLSSRLEAIDVRVVELMTTVAGHSARIRDIEQIREELLHIRNQIDNVLNHCKMSTNQQHNQDTTQNTNVDVKQGVGPMPQHAVLAILVIAILVAAVLLLAFFMRDNDAPQKRRRQNASVGVARHIGDEDLAGYPVFRIAECG